MAPRIRFDKDGATIDKGRDPNRPTVGRARLAQRTRSGIPPSAQEARSESDAQTRDLQTGTRAIGEGNNFYEQTTRQAANRTIENADSPTIGPHERDDQPATTETIRQHDPQNISGSMPSGPQLIQQIQSNMQPQQFIQQIVPPQIMQLLELLMFLMQLFKRLKGLKTQQNQVRDLMNRVRRQIMVEVNEANIQPTPPVNQNNNPFVTDRIETIQDAIKSVSLASDRVNDILNDRSSDDTSMRKERLCQ